MKKFIFGYIVTLIMTVQATAQQNNTASDLQAIPPLKIKVTDKATTVLVFDYSVIDADRGSSQLFAEKVPGVENVLKLRAAGALPDTTNLHVFTGDGKVHAFQITYVPAPDVNSYHVLSSTPVTTGTIFFDSKSNEKELATFIEKARNEQPFMHRSKRRFQLKLTLAAIFVHKETLVFRFTIRNNATLSYQGGWASMYMTDKRTAKRTSVQQLPLSPVYADSLPRLNSSTASDWLIAIPKTTLPDKKRLVFEMQEKNGGRHIQFIIRNKHLLRAKPI